MGADAALSLAKPGLPAKKSSESLDRRPQTVGIADNATLNWQLRACEEVEGCVTRGTIW